MKQNSIRKFVSELFEEGQLDVMVKLLKSQAPSNKLTICRPKRRVVVRPSNNAKLLNRAPKGGRDRQQQHVLTVLFKTTF
jgi:hypothetical protein